MAHPRSALVVVLSSFLLSGTAAAFPPVVPPAPSNPETPAANAQPTAPAATQPHTPPTAQPPQPTAPPPAPAGRPYPPYPYYSYPPYAPYPPYGSPGYPAGPRPPTLQELHVQQNVQRSREVLAHRLLYRQVPRLTLTLRGGGGVPASDDVSDQQVNATVGGIGVGYRQHTSPSLGFQIGAVVWSGNASLDDDTDSTSLTMAQLEGGLVFGPFGRFYFSPGLSVAYLWPGRTQLQSWSRTFRIDTLETVIHGDGGLLLGSREQFEIGFRFGVSITGHPWFSVSCAYHFLMGDAGYQRR